MSLLWKSKEQLKEDLTQQSASFIVCFTACLTSLIFQQYRNRFNVELKQSKIIATATFQMTTESNEYFLVWAITISTVHIGA